MSERAYTAREVHEMRLAISRDFGDGAFKPIERGAAIEDRIRTYMTANTDPSDVVAEIKARADVRREDRKQTEEMWREMMRRRRGEGQ